jgi:hypothetical protein
VIVNNWSLVVVNDVSKKVILLAAGEEMPAARE